MVDKDNEVYQISGNEKKPLGVQFPQPVVFIDAAITNNTLLVLTERKAYVYNSHTFAQIGWFFIDSPSAYVKLGEGVFCMGVKQGLKFYSISQYSLQRNISRWQFWKSIPCVKAGDSTSLTTPQVSRMAFDSVKQILYAKADTGIISFSEACCGCPLANANYLFEDTIAWQINANGIPESNLIQKHISDTTATSQKSEAENVDIVSREMGLWFWTSVTLALLAVVAWAIFFYIKNTGKRETRNFVSAQTEIPGASLPIVDLTPMFLQVLDAIQLYVLKGEKVMAHGMLENFRRLLLLTLEGSKQKNATVNHEIEIIRLYLQLQQVRLKNSFQFTLSKADNVAEDRKIPSLLLFLLLEDAVKNSLSCSNKQTRLLIVFSITGMSLQVTIDDDGIQRDAPSILNSNVRSQFENKQPDGNRLTLLM